MLHHVPREPITGEHDLCREVVRLRSVRLLGRTLGLGHVLGGEPVDEPMATWPAADLTLGGHGLVAWHVIVGRGAAPRTGEPLAHTKSEHAHVPRPKN